METSVEMVKMESSGETTGKGTVDIETESFCVELKLCLIDGGNREIQLLKVRNVLSFFCVCSTCGKKFLVQSSLKSHMKTHTKTEMILQNSITGTSTSTGDGSTSTLNDNPAVTEEVVDGADNVDNDKPDSGNVGADNCVVRAASVGANSTREADGLGQDSDGKDNNNEGSDADAGADDYYASDTDVEEDVGEYSIESVADSCAEGADDEGADDEADNEKTMYGDTDHGTSVSYNETNVDGKGAVNKQMNERSDANTCSAVDQNLPSGPDTSTGQVKAMGYSSQKVSAGYQNVDSKPIKTSSELKLLTGPINMDPFSHGPKNLSHTGSRKRVRKSKAQNEKKNTQECSYCGKIFRGKQKFVDHIHLHTGEKPYTCSVCGNAFRRKSQLNVHSRIHRGEDLHCCEECGKQFTTASAMRDHSKVHTDVKPFLCPTCGKQFRNKKDATYHIRAHTGQQTYRCTICEKGFNRPSSLNDHMKIHTGEKPHQCSVCGKTFRLLATYRNHASLHEDEAVCTICGNSFQNRALLTSHICVEHKGSPTTCEICGKVFKGPKTLRVHYTTHT